ncbi:hypothetical protein BD769DRAFT_1544518 [Suillus cothurnatus]|nr:hypothetical protein BD769DRAFT_1544518 [Suillus cothurnatus]
MGLMMVQIVQDSGKSSFALAASGDIGKCKDTTIIILSAIMLSWTDLEVRTGFWNVSLLKKPKNSTERRTKSRKHSQHTVLLPILRSKRRLTHFRRVDGLGVSDSSLLSLLIQNSLNMCFLDVPICNTAVLGLGKGTGGKANTRGDVEGGG